jgi:hypothetical protein
VPYSSHSQFILTQSHKKARCQKDRHPTPPNHPNHPPIQSSNPPAIPAFRHLGIKSSPHFSFSHKATKKARGRRSEVRRNGIQHLFSHKASKPQRRERDLPREPEKRAASHSSCAPVCPIPCIAQVSYRLMDVPKARPAKFLEFYNYPLLFLFVSPCEAWIFCSHTKPRSHGEGDGSFGLLPMTKLRRNASYSA